MEISTPRPFSFAGFDTFNAGYRALLDEWKLLVDGENPIARTNVAPVVGGPREPSLYAFSYTVASESGRPSFVVAGAPLPGSASEFDVPSPHTAETRYRPVS